MRDVPNYDVVRWRGRTASACVLIPVINEGERIGRLLSRMHALNIAGIADIIVVDGGSTDGSLEADRLDAANVVGLLVKRGPGKLSAQLRCAYDFVLTQGYDEIITIDGNDKDDPDPIPNFIAAIQDGFDFVQASRFVPGGVEENTPAKRRFAVRYIHAPALSIASGFHWTDTTQGFRAYSRRLLTDERVDIFRPEFTTYELLAYLNYRAPRLGYRCTEMPTARRYPADEAVPTKIDFRGEIGLLATLARTCLGGFDPASAPTISTIANYNPRWISPGERLIRNFVISLLFVLAITVVIAVYFQFPINDRLVDLFQEGELLAPRLYFESSNILPLLIHGQIDYIPSQFASSVCMPSAIITCTRIVNASLNMISALMFLTCTVTICRRGGKARVYALLLALAVIVMINGGRSSSVGLHQGAPALRDLGLFAILSLFLLAERRPGYVRKISIFFAAFIAGIGVFFSYNRGVTGIIALVLALCVTIVTWRDRIAVSLGIAGLIAGALIVSLENPAMASQHISNIVYWAKHGSIWAYGPSITLLFLGLSFYLPIGITLLIGIVGGVLHWKNGRNINELPALTLLFIICGIVTQQSISRYDPTHLSFAAPWFFLTVVALMNWVKKSNKGISPADGIALLTFLGIIFLDNIREGSLISNIGWNFVNNVRTLRHGIPQDADLIDDNLRKAAKVIIQSGEYCTYAADNSAAIYHLTNKIPCSSVMIPVYVSLEIQNKVISDLYVSNPVVVLWDSSNWSNNIDNRSMSFRTPLLARWLISHYPYEIKYGDVVLRTRDKNFAKMYKKNLS